MSENCLEYQRASLFHEGGSLENPGHVLFEHITSLVKHIAAGAA